MSWLKKQVFGGIRKLIKKGQDLLEKTETPGAPARSFAVEVAKGDLKLGEKLLNRAIGYDEMVDALQHNPVSTGIRILDKTITSGQKVLADPSAAVQEYLQAEGRSLHSDPQGYAIDKSLDLLEFAALSGEGGGSGGVQGSFEAIGAAGEEGEFRVLFGQKQISPRFSLDPKVPSHLRGRLVNEVADDLLTGKLHPDDIPINAFLDKRTNVLVSANSRSLAALSKAKKLPTNVTRIALSKDLMYRLVDSEMQPVRNLLGDPLPATRVPVVEHGQIKEIISLPGH